MANQKILFIFVVFLMMIQSSLTRCKSPNTKRGSSEKCHQSPCENYSSQQAIVGLWSIVGEATPLVTELKNTIISLLPGCNKRVLGLLTGVSLWTVDRLTEFNVPLLPVFESLISQTISRRNACNNKLLNKAVNDYGVLCHSAISNTIQVGLRAAGCPTTKDCGKKNIEPLSCGTECIQQFLKSIVSPMPEKLKDVVVRLSMSSHKVDQAVAAGCVAAATPSSLDLFETLMNSDELLKVLRLKGCNFKISEKSCHARKKELQHECQKLSKKVSEIISVLTS